MEPKRRDDRSPDEKRRQEELDEALEKTFPASDPIEAEQPGSAPERRRGEILSSCRSVAG
jgi:hypothetical protein